MRLQSPDKHDMRSLASFELYSDKEHDGLLALSIRNILAIILNYSVLFNFTNIDDNNNIIWECEHPDRVE